MFKNTNPKLFKQLRRKTLRKNRWPILGRTFFPRSILMWIILLMQWIPLIIYTVMQVNHKKYIPGMFSGVVVPLLTLYLWVFLYVFWKSRNGIKQIGRSYFFKGWITHCESKSDGNQYVPVIYNSVTIKCPQRGEIMTSNFIGHHEFEHGDVVYVFVDKNYNPLGFVNLNSKTTIELQKHFSIRNFLAVFSDYIGSKESKGIVVENKEAEEKIGSRTTMMVHKNNELDNWTMPFEKMVQKISWDDVILEDEVKRNIQRSLTLMLEPEKYADMGKKAPKGILLFGPPGTGKTTIAKAMAAQKGLWFCAVSAGELTNGVYGVSEKRIRDLFEQAKQKSPCIVFIDEIDSLLPKRGSNATSTFKDDIVAQFLQEMDGIASVNQGNIIIVGATNRIDRMDEAVLRPGRFDKQIEIPLPNVSLRKKLWQLFLSGKSVKEDIDLDELTEQTNGFSGAEIYGIVEEAIDIVIDRVEADLSTDREISNMDLLNAILKVQKNIPKYAIG